MGCLRQFNALLWKNLLLKRRNPVASACEIALPVFFILIMVVIYRLFDTSQFDTSELTKPEDIRTVLPLSILPARIKMMRNKLAIVPRTLSERSVVDQFVSDMSILHPSLNGSTIGNVGFNNSILRNIYIPGFKDIVRIFDSETDLEKFVTNINYDRAWEDNSGEKIWGAIIFNSGPPNWDYSIRMNLTQVVPTTGDKVNVLRRGHSFAEIDKYYEARLQTTGPPFLQEKGTEVSRQPYPGFLSLQLAVDRWILNQSVPFSDLDPLRTVNRFGDAIRRVLPPWQAGLFFKDIQTINSTNPMMAAAILQDIVQWMKEDTFAPQQVDFVPFPYLGYTSNGFYGLVLNILSFFLVIGFVFPVSRLIRGLVLEKEMKMREGMKMMGLSDIALFGSWIASYVIFWAILAGIITGISGNSIFKASNKINVWGVFFLFGLSSTTFSYLISIFFSRAKTASSLGVVIFIASYFPTFSVSDGGVATSTKMAASLLAPTAFGLSINSIGNLEDNGAGATSDTFAEFINNFSVQSGFGMMILDTLLYGVLAWYIDNILPASIREFGVPRPWYFPFTLNYWREVFNLPLPPASPKQNLTPPPDNFIRNFFGRRISNTPSTVHHTSELEKMASITASFIEEPDANLRAKEKDGRCVAIQKLRKEFDTPDGVKVAVNNIDMTMYEGQIFVLLGHNGAGKTTTISMLTGLIPPSGGNAVIFGRDVSSQLTSIRKDLGICPQHDVLWPELTVQEHLEIFTAIKDVPRNKCKTEIAKAIAEVGLTEKVNTLSSKLSGGQKRKLSVCIALAGGSKVIFLDEPTSGMDPYSRRSTWQILQNAREGRVMVLTTHFMDEADILGDRIAIMAEGGVKCCGSPMFLKKRFGVGYILTLIKGTPKARTDEAIQLIRKYVPEVTVATNVGAELSLRLPLGSSTVFPEMLKVLDASIQEFGITSYGISITSIEDVFLKISAGEALSHDSSSSSNQPLLLEDDTVKPGKTLTDSDNTSNVTVVPTNNIAGPIGRKGANKAGNNSNVNKSASAIDAVRAEAREEQTGFQTFVRHTKALLIKRWNYSKRDGKALAYQILLPFILIAAGLALIQSGQVNTFPDYQFSTAQFNADRRVNINLPKYPLLVPNFRFKAGTGAADSVDVTSALLAIPSTNATLTDQNLFFTTGTVNSVSDPYNFVTATTEPRRTYQQMSALLISDKPTRVSSKYGAYVWTKDNTILLNQHPTATYPNNGQATYSVFYNSSGLHSAPVFMNLQNSALYRLKNGGGGSITARSHPLPRTERESSLFAGLLVFSASIIIVIAFSFQASSTALYIVKEKEVAAKHQQLISGVSIISYWASNFIFDLFIYAISAALAILLAFAFKITEFTEGNDERLAGFILTFFFYGLALIGSTYLLSFFFKSPSSAQNTILFINMSAILLIAASQFLSQLASACRAEVSLRYIFRLLPSFSFGWNLVSLAFLTSAPLIDASCDVFNGIQRGPSDYLPYKALELRSTGTSLVFLAVEGFVYLVGVITIEYILSQPKLRMYFRRDPVVQDPAIDDDEDVVTERNRVSQQVSSSNITDVVLLDQLRKVYPGGKVAVRGVSYGLPVGEVFGFLGINGAGKTTTLQMLSGDVLPSTGTAVLGGYDIISQQPQVRRLLGYCPQFDALLELLTVREHLELYARIKGVPEADVKSVVDTKLTEMDLQQFSNKKAGTLSGGNKRKLSVAIALIGNPPIVFLDEPSTGMDPVARRFMWSVISRIATENKQCSIILTTHSMEEVEALCTRIGIMVGGRLRCLGTAQHLKNRHGNGYMSEIKFAEPSTLLIDNILTAATTALGGSIHDISTMMVKFDQVPFLANALGNPYRGTQINEMGSGWAIYSAFMKSTEIGRAIPLREFAVWWATEGIAHDLVMYMHTSFPDSHMVERQGTTLRYRIPNNGDTLSTLFGKLERARNEYQVVSYTLGQTTLEQIFVQFAGQQTEEKGVARGMNQTTNGNDTMTPSLGLRPNNAVIGEASPV